MLEKPAIIHVIDSLARGGAETLLVDLLEDLSESYRVIIVTLYDACDFDKSKLVCEKRYCLQYKGFTSVPSCAFRLRKIIRQYNPLLVHAHLYTSSVVARIATPKKTPLVFSIHTMLSIENYNKKKLSLVAEKLTYRKHHHVISVSKQALADFSQYVGLKGPSYILYNFIHPLYFQNSRLTSYVNGKELKMVAVGNLKESKNYAYLIEAFKGLKNFPVSLDIYGDGPLRASLQQLIDEGGVNVTLKGSCREIFRVLPQYDLYTMSSFYEGFPVAPLEAMAIGLPMLLSELPVLKESIGANAMYFNQNDPDSFIAAINLILSGKIDLQQFSANGIELALKNYQRKDYVYRLKNVYAAVSAQ